MIKRIGLLAVALLGAPLVAQAAIIEIDYSGRINYTQGSGLGYNLGDTVSGKLRVDLSKSIGNVSATPEKFSYHTPLAHDMVTGYLPANAGQPMDFVDVYNNSYSTYDGRLVDYLSVFDGTRETLANGEDSLTSQLQLSFNFNGIDWIKSYNITNVNIATQDAFTLGSSFGAIANYLRQKNEYGQFEYTNDVAYFSFDSVNISQVSEPGSIVLLLLGALGLAARRKTA
ncbi:MAG: hypothetical protein B0W54_05460 [Cellvibrio sp. 79]|nr:MAG: hypothetical protein B0W54_05460 [Cellvibrio sp. 79]